MTVTQADRVTCTADRLWLELVERAGELDCSRPTPEERRRALAASGLSHWDEDCLSVDRVKAVAGRHTAIRPGDLLVVRRSGGIYSETTDVCFVRLS